MDSFIKKKKDNNGSQDRGHTPMKIGQTETAEKIVPEYRPQSLLQNEQTENFKELISNGQFSYEKIVIEKPRKRRMDFDDDEPPKKYEPEEVMVPDPESDLMADFNRAPKVEGSVKNKRKSQHEKKKNTFMVSIPGVDGDENGEEFEEVTPQWASP